jgi:ribonuclease D
MSAHGYTLVDGPSALAELAAVLESSAWHALDTESNSGFAYLERLCLLQFNVGGRIWLVDPLALGGRDGIEPLRAPLEDPGRTTYLHGGEFDVGCFKRDYDLQLAGVWDSQQAAAFLGFTKTGYGSVVEQICGVELAKAYTHYDWAQRPLQEAVLAYAVDDVLYLPEICEALTARVAEADLEEEVAIAHRVVEASTWDGSYRPDGFWKIKGVGKLSTSSLPLLAELWKWRDQVARDEDRAPGRTLNNRTMLALSRNPPRNAGALRRMGVPGRVAGSRHGVELLKLVHRVRRQQPEVPKRPSGPAPGTGNGRAERGRGDALKTWRNAEAERRGVPVQVVLPSRALDYLKRNGAEDLEAVPQLGPKRIRLYGEALRKLLAEEPARPTPERGETTS